MVVAGIDRMERRSFGPQAWAGKVYLVDPRNNRLWGLKIALREAAEAAGIGLLSSFTSDRYRVDLLKIGISYVHFHDDRKRFLGVRGNDLGELLDPHAMYLPDGRMVADGAARFLPSEAEAGGGAPEDGLAYESRARGWHLRYERRVANSRSIKAKLGLTCEGCGLDAEQAFGR